MRKTHAYSSCSSWSNCFRRYYIIVLLICHYLIYSDYYIKRSLCRALHSIIYYVIFLKLHDTHTHVSLYFLFSDLDVYPVKSIFEVSRSRGCHIYHHRRCHWFKKEQIEMQQFFLSFSNIFPISLWLIPCMKHDLTRQRLFYILSGMTNNLLSSVLQMMM